MQHVSRGCACGGPNGLARASLSGTSACISERHISVTCMIECAHARWPREGQAPRRPPCSFAWMETQPKRLHKGSSPAPVSPPAACCIWELYPRLQLNTLACARPWAHALKQHLSAAPRQTCQQDREPKRKQAMLAHKRTVRAQNGDALSFTNDTVDTQLSGGFYGRSNSNGKTHNASQLSGTSLLPIHLGVVSIGRRANKWDGTPQGVMGRLRLIKRVVAVQKYEGIRGSDPDQVHADQILHRSIDRPED